MQLDTNADVAARARAVLGQPPASNWPDVATRVRGVLGEQQVSGSELARRVGCAQRYMSRRLSGDVPFTVAELMDVAAVLHVSIARFLPEDASEPVAS